MSEIFQYNEQLPIAQEKLRPSFKRIFWDINVSKLDFE